MLKRWKRIANKTCEENADRIYAEIALICDANHFYPSKTLTNETYN